MNLNCQHMSAIFLKNTTGLRSGNYVRFEYGEDLFGHIFLDIVKGHGHSGKLARSLVFDDPASFIRTLDLEICRSEDRNYLPV